MTTIAAPDLSLRPLGLQAERAMAASPSVLFSAWTEQFKSLVCGAGVGVDESGSQRRFLFRDTFRGYAASALRALHQAGTRPASN
jgi:hypothetical protein